MKLGQNLAVALLMTLVMTAALGLAYPLVVTGLAQACCPERANGQLIYRNGRLVGSRLLGQVFVSPGYFRSRPSAVDYDAGASGGSNLGPTNRVLIDRVRAATAAAQRENSGTPVPIDLVTASASGIDPHISPDAAVFQAPRIARERMIGEREVRDLIREFTEDASLGLFGEARVSVLPLNLALDERYPVRRLPGGLTPGRR